MVDVGVPVGGAAHNMNEKGELDPSMPAWFTTYLKVADIDAAVADVSAHGGQVFVQPMQIGDMGSMAIVAAPSGAAFGLWQTGTFDGFDTSGRPGTAVWFESLTTDFDADAAFYREVLGWETPRKTRPAPDTSPTPPMTPPAPVSWMPRARFPRECPPTGG